MNVYGQLIAAQLENLSAAPAGVPAGRVYFDTTLHMPRYYDDNGTTWRTLADLTSTQTLSGKTLTSPTLSAPVLGTPASGNLANCLGLPVGGGGTGVTSVTTAPTASSFAGWDANSNLSAVNHIEGYATTATAASTTTLVVGDKFQQFFTGSTTQTVKLPVASTLVLGHQFQITNLSSGIVTVQSSGANAIQAQGANTIGTYTCVLTSGTSAASWSVVYSSILAGLANPMATAGDMIYGGAAGAVTNLATGATAGVLHGGNAATPTWSQIVDADVSSSAAIAGSKLVAASASVAGAVTTGTQTMAGDKTFSGNTTLGGSGDAQATSQNASTSTSAHVVTNTNSSGTSIANLVIKKAATATDGTQKLVRFLTSNSTEQGAIVGGGANAAAFGTISDARRKENIQSLPPQLQNIMTLRPVEFDYKDGSGHQIGFIAQEMREVYPDAVNEDETGFLSIAGWSKTEARLVKAIQELKADFDAYKNTHP